MKTSAFLLGFLALAMATNTVEANSKYNCTSTHCDYRYTQKAMGTHSYSGQCNGNVMNLDAGKMSCVAGEKPMTCTNTFYQPVGSKSGPASCTCTNWSMTKKRDAKISISCNS